MNEFKRKARFQNAEKGNNMMKNLLQDVLLNKLDAKMATPSRKFRSSARGKESMNRGSVNNDKIEYLSNSKYDQITQKADDADELLLDPDMVNIPMFGLTKNKGIGMVSGPIDLNKIRASNKSILVS